MHNMTLSGPSPRVFVSLFFSALLLGGWVNTAIAAEAAQPATASAQAAGTDLLNPDHPTEYTVVKGDTLWDISGRFLRKPWLWPEVWQVNPQIRNPHLIYPGDVISLVYIDGQPRLRLGRGGTEKLSPHVRVLPIDQAIPTIPVDAIGPFLSRTRAMDEATLASAAYIVSSPDEHLVTGAGDRVYARGIDDSATQYGVYRPGPAYIDPDTQEVLGHEALYIGDASVQRPGDPATLVLTKTTREANNGDKLLPQGQEDIVTHFLPHAPADGVSGRVIAVVDGVTQIGQRQVVVLNRGTREGMEVGHVLAVHRAGETIRDRFAANPKETVTLPDEHAGEVMVYRTYEKVSFALVMRATRSIHVLDRVTTP